MQSAINEDNWSCCIQLCNLEHEVCLLDIRFYQVSGLYEFELMGVFLPCSNLVAQCLKNLARPSLVIVGVDEEQVRTGGVGGTPGTRADELGAATEELKLRVEFD